MVQEEPDCIIIGAGILGCPLAFSLSNQGRKVTVIERDMSEPNRIVGELLQPSGIYALQKMGLDSCIEGIDGISSKGYGIFYDNEMVKLPYLNNDRGVGFHHGRFIMKLRDACLKQANITFIEGTANEILYQNANVVGVSYSLKGDSENINELRGRFVVAADGCFSKFRKEIKGDEIAVRSHFAGIVVEECPLIFPNHGHVVLTNPSPVLLYQIGTNETRILFDIPGKVPSNGNGDLKKYLLNEIVPQLPVQLRPSVSASLEREKIRMMPNQRLSASPNTVPGLVILGDALNMRHPLTGGGMTVAFNDVILLTNLLENVGKLSYENEEFTRQISIFHKERKNHCMVINVLAFALYELFSAGDDESMKVLRKACFTYFTFGGLAVDHPIGFLSGMNTSRFLLVFHFFAVAFVGIFSTLFTLRNYVKFPSCLAILQNLLDLLISFPVNVFKASKVLVDASSTIGTIFLREMQ